MKKFDLKTLVATIAIVVAIIPVIIFKDDLFGKKKEEIKKDDEFSYTPVLYEICDDDSCNYLMGAIHLGDNRVEKLSDKVYKVYDEMDSVAIEANTDNVGIEDLILPEGVTNDTLMSEELVKKLEEFSNKHLFFQYDKFKNYKLGFIYSELELMPFIEKGYLVYGPDTLLANKAKKDGKEVLYLEDIELQMKLIIGYSDAFYAKQIEDIIDNYDKIVNLNLNLYETYLEGDVDKLTKIIEEDENEEKEVAMTDEEKEYLDELYTKRNIEMSNKIEAFLASNKKVFTVVGAAHVVGKNGIIDLLSNKNYKITLIK